MGGFSLSHTIAYIHTSKSYAYSHTHTHTYTLFILYVGSRKLCAFCWMVQIDYRSTYTQNHMSVYGYFDDYNECHFIVFSSLSTTTTITRIAQKYNWINNKSNKTITGMECVAYGCQPDIISGSIEWNLWVNFIKNLQRERQPREGKVTSFRNSSKILCIYEIS